MILVAVSLSVAVSVLAAPLAQEQKPTIAEPKADAAVRGVVQIVGSATHPQFQRYELYYAPFPIPSDQAWIFIGDAHFQQQPLGLLGTWPTSSLPDGQYALRVRVVKQDGNYIDGESRRVQVANKRAVETPTPLPTFERAPTSAPTVAPTPTLVAAPTIAAPRPATPTPRADTTPILQLTPGSGTPAPGGSELFSGARLLDIAVQAATYTVAVFAAIGVFFAIKWLLAWLWHKIRP
jgi:hypothetical protein